MKNIAVMSNNSFGLDNPDYVDNYVLAAGVAETVTIPHRATHAFFSANADFFAKYTGTATVPGADIVDGTGSELNPTVRTFPATVSPAAQTTFSIISAAGGILSIAYYRS